MATDRDGDEITLNAGSFTIAVQDDIPVQNAVTVAATVQEDGLNAAVDEPPAGASGNDLSTGNKEGGETDAADETSWSGGFAERAGDGGGGRAADHQPVAGEQHAADAVLAGRSGHLLASTARPTR